MRVALKTPGQLVIEAPRRPWVVVALSFIGATGLIALVIGVTEANALFAILGSVFLGLPLFTFATAGDCRVTFVARSQTVTLRRKHLFGERVRNFTFDEVAAVLPYENDGSHTLQLQLQDGSSLQLEAVYTYNPAVYALAEEIQLWLAERQRAAT